MKNLWTHIGIYAADTSGAASVLQNSTGLALIEDVRSIANLFYEFEHGQNIDAKRVDITQMTSYEVISGASELFRQRFEEKFREVHPEFAILGGGPLSSSIGTDINLLSKKLSAEYGIPVVGVDLDGKDFYDVGIDKTLLALAKTLTPSCPEQPIPNTVNLVGSNSFDIVEGNLTAIRQWLKDQGIEIVSEWGSNLTAENMHNSSFAALNMVVSASGLTTAKYLNSVFGTPYVVGVPYGEGNSRLLKKQLGDDCQGKAPAAPVIEESGEAEVLILGEQLQGLAIRNTLRMDFGGQNIAVGSFFMMHNQLMESQDRRFQDENALSDYIKNHPGLKLVIGDGSYSPFVPDDCKFLELPHKGLSLLKGEADLAPLVGDGLNLFLKQTES